MHQAKKGNEWHFGMKAHIGTDADSGLVHSLTGTAANVADITESEHLLHGDETEAYADAGYTGVAKRPEFQDSDSSGMWPKSAASLRRWKRALARH